MPINYLRLLENYQKRRNSQAVASRVNSNMDDSILVLDEVRDLKTPNEDLSVDHINNETQR